MIGRLIRAAAKVVIGLVGTVAITAAAAFIIENQVPIQLPPSFVGTSMWSEFVMARGTWTLEGDRMAFPLQTTEISCVRRSMTCTTAQAEIAFGKLLSASSNRYDIVRWDESVLIAKDTSAVCVDYTYTIDRASQRVIGTRTTKSTSSDCANISQAPLSLTLSDGFAVWRRLRDEAQGPVDAFMWMGLGAWWLLTAAWIWNGWRSVKALPHSRHAALRFNG